MLTLHFRPGCMPLSRCMHPDDCSRNPPSAPNFASAAVRSSRLLESKDIHARPAGRGIPSLDGLRAFSIALVVLAHAQQTRGFPAWISSNLTGRGALGVHVFFVISGFLITTLLLEERAKTGGISLKLFYARRALRIFPPYYCFLLAAAAGTWIGRLHVPARNLLMAATYTTNYLSTGINWVTVHTWSLSVEEQFYLVWPLTILWAGSRRAFWIAALVAIVSPAINVELYRAGHPEALNYFPVVAAPIAAGCLLAQAMFRLRGQMDILRWFRAPLGGLVLPLILCIDFVRYDHPRINLALAEPLMTLCICYAIVRYTQFPDTFAGRLFNLPAVAFAGRLSYSLYLWQQLCMFPHGAGLLQTFPLNIGVAFAAR